MKKILYSLLGLGCLALTSCDMDHAPVGSIIDENAIERANDCARFRSGFYSDLRAVSVGAYITLSELQMDHFIGIISNGNVNGPINNGVILSGDSDMEAVWGGLYGVIADINFFLEKADLLLQNGVEDVTERQEIELYIAEAHFMRAYFYYWLMDHYCPAYNDENKDKLLGLPIVTKYQPTSKKDNYPGRSTLEQTYTFIKDELALAMTGIATWEALPDDDGINHKSAIAVNSPYVCTYTIEALQARVALLQRDFKTAITKAQNIIDNGPYSLVQGKAYEAMWKNDESAELILRPLSTQQFPGIGSTGGAWIGSSEYTAYYIPVPYCGERRTQGTMYINGDSRFANFFHHRDLQVEGRIVDAPVFVKFPGNQALRVNASVNNLLNMAKPFRLSEQYLILAEALYEDGQEGPAQEIMQKFVEKRYSVRTCPTMTDYNGTELRDFIREERDRELIGEGFRMSDLRRWGLGFTRTDVNYLSYPQAGSICTLAGQRVTYVPNDYRYTWPIPSAEIQVNPALAGQQNPGY